MNINCIICSDSFLPISEIYSTTCGHMFHYVCLMQWIERSKTCPQCRHKCSDRNIHRIYLNLQNTDGIENDAGTLQIKLDNLEFQIRVKEKDIKECISKYKTVKTQNVGLKDEVRNLEMRQKTCESAMSALKDQIMYFKQKAKENEKLNNEVHRLNNKLKNVENIDTVLRGSKEQVNDMLRHNQDAASLSIMVSSLKSELMDSDKKKKQISSNLYKMQNEVGTYKRECTELNNDLQRLKCEIEAHKNCEKQRQYLKQKIIELESKVSANSSLSYTPNKSIRRIIGESPAPMLNTPKLDDALLEINFDSKNDSPTVMEKVKAIEDSDSPYLSLKSQNHGINSFLAVKYAVTSGTKTASTSKYSIFKTQKFENVKSKPDYSYDGFGGHSKDEKYPSPKKSQSGGLKRAHKSSSSISSSKFRKLSDKSGSSMLKFLDK